MASKTKSLSNLLSMENHMFPHIPSQESLDWAYAMRREMQEILPNLYLGPYAAAMKSKLNVLTQTGITHIICIRQAVEANFIRANFPDHFRYLVLDIADSVTENIIQYIPQVRQFLEECFCSGGKALVHGNAGISRSAALVIAYVMEKYGLTYKDTFLYVQQKRFCINPNDGFAQQLTKKGIDGHYKREPVYIRPHGTAPYHIQEYEPIYRAKLSFLSGSRSTDNCLLKRKYIDDTDEDEEMRLPT